MKLRRSSFIYETKTVCAGGEGPVGCGFHEGKETFLSGEARVVCVDGDGIVRSSAVLIS